MDSKIYLPTLLITLSTIGRCQQPITCEAGRFKAGQTASVTCNFHRSVKDIRHHVYVVQYPHDAPDDSLGTGIVSCFRSFDLKLICDAAKGVQMNSDVTNRLTFHIPGVTTDFAGRYACQLVPPDDTVIVFCSMTVEGTFKQNKTDAAKIAQPDGSTRLKFTIATTAVVCFLGILCWITYYCIKRRRRSCSRGNSTQFDAVKPKYQDGHVLANASFGRADSSGRKSKKNFNYNHYHTVSDQTDPHFCQDKHMSLEPIKCHNRSTCRADSYSFGAVESKIDNTEICTGRRFVIVRSHSLCSISCRRDDDSSNSSIYVSLHGDDFNSGNDTDGGCSFYSSSQSTWSPLKQSQIR